MIALAQLNFDFPSITTRDSIQKGLRLLHSKNFNLVAVLEGKKWIGNLTEGMLAHAKHPDGKIDQLIDQFNKYSIASEEDILASLPIFEETGFSLLPVVNDAFIFQGYLTWQSVAKRLFYTGFNTKSGGIIQIVFHTQRDSMATIARIIEENNGIITRSYLTKSDKLEHVLPEMIIQIQTEQFPAIIRNLERHEVQIEKAFMFGQTENADQSRFDLLVKYLTM